MLVPFHVKALEDGLHSSQGKVGERTFSQPVVLAGKSMGSRVGCHVSISENSVPLKALICFGYPLKGGNGSIRDQVLLDLKTPILFIQGTRDKYGFHTALSILLVRTWSRTAD